MFDGEIYFFDFSGTLVPSTFLCTLIFLQVCLIEPSLFLIALPSLPTASLHTSLVAEKPQKQKAGKIYF